MVLGEIVHELCRIAALTMVADGMTRSISYINHDDFSLYFPPDKLPAGEVVKVTIEWVDEAETEAIK